MVERVLSMNRKYRVAVAWAHDANSLGAINKAVSDGFAEAYLIGNIPEIEKACNLASIKSNIFKLIQAENEVLASVEAVRMVKSGEADIVMKGLVGTDKFLKAVMDKTNGLMLPGAVLSYVCALELPDYHKLLFITDPAVIPFPDLNRKIAMVTYAIGMTKKFGVEKPKVALIGASEKVSKHFDYSADYSVMRKMAACGQIEDCILDGPLDIFLACDKKSVEIKGIDTPINGDADVLLFPSLEACNPFYKGLMLFGHGKMAGLIRGTSKPVIVMSRSESEQSKYYCIAMSCLMA